MSTLATLAVHCFYPLFICCDRSHKLRSLLATDFTCHSTIITVYPYASVPYEFGLYFISRILDSGCGCNFICVASIVNNTNIFSPTKVEYEVFINLIIN